MDEDQNYHYKNLLNHPILGHREERETLRLSATGSSEAREKMVLHNMRLVYREAGISNSYIPFDDRFQAGILGLYKALSKFDITKGLRFSTYAVPWIRQSIQRAELAASLLRLPQNIKELLKEREKFSKIYSQKNGIDPHKNLIKDHLQKSVTQKASDSILEFVATYNGTYLFDIADPPFVLSDGANIEDDIVNKMKSLEFQRILEKILDTREHIVLAIRYELNGQIDCRSTRKDGKVTLLFIAKRLGITGERVRQIEVEAMEKLKNYFEQNLHNRSD